MRSKFFLILTFLLAVLGPPAFSEIKVSGSVDKKKVALNDTLRLSVVVEGSGSVPAPQMPDLSAFNVYSSGRSENVSFVNGRMSSSVSYNYTLMPKNAGKFLIGPFTITSEGKTFQSQPLEIEVAAESSAPPASPAQRSGPEQAQAPGAFVKLSVDKSKAFVNEQVILSFRFYRRIRLVANPQYQPPELTGFLHEDLPPPKNFSESLNGVGYQVTEIKTALFPVKAGKSVIPPATLRIAVQDFQPGNPNDLFSMFFSGGAKEYILKTDPVELIVSALPIEGKPRGFSGGVGEFGLSADLDKPNPVVGEPVTLAVSVSGSGNVKSLGDPVFPDFSGFRKYDTASSLNVETSQGKVEGSKVYKTILVPQSSGRHTIPPVSFSYFNLKERKYKTLAAAPLILEVKPGKAVASPPSPQGFEIPEIKKMQEEIRYLKLSGASARPFTWIHKTRTFLILNIVPVLGLLAAGFWRLRSALILRNPEKRRRSRALKNAERILKNKDAFEALTAYLADKMLVSPQGLLLKQAEGFLTEKKTEAATIAELKSLWSDLEISHYAPARFRGLEPGQAALRTKGLLKKIEKTLSVFAVLFLGAFLFSARAGVFDEANRDYQEGRYDQALSKYESLESQSGANGALEFNLGNAHYKLGALGKALVHWHRAWRMSPLDSDVRFNLKYGSSRAGDPFFPENRILSGIKIFANAVNLNGLSVLWLAALWIFCLYFGFLLFRGEPLWDLKSGILFAALLLFGGWMLDRLNEEEWKTWAAAVQPKVEVRSGPGTQFAVGFTIPDGRRVLVMEDNPGIHWVEIGVPKEGLKGWVPRGEIEKI